jgi:hypothetical protein
MQVPTQWREYPCDDYFASDLAHKGWWDPAGQCWYIEPAARVFEDSARAFLVIGRPGVDGIAWGYRKAHPGVWAYYPIDDSFTLLAESAAALHDGYSTGRIVV